MEYAEYLEAVFITLRENTEWRLGQTLFNVLAQERPDLSEQIRSAREDPFFADPPEKIRRFLTWVRENW